MVRVSCAITHAAAGGAGLVLAGLITVILFHYSMVPLAIVAMTRP